MIIAPCRRSRPATEVTGAEHQMLVECKDERVA
jgi:hypothetical protein